MRCKDPQGKNMILAHAVKTKLVEGLNQNLKQEVKGLEDCAI